MPVRLYEDVDALLTALFHAQLHSCILQFQCVLPLPMTLWAVNKGGGRTAKKALS